MQMEHVTARELGNARYGLDMTLPKGHISLNNPGLGGVELLPLNELWARCC